MSNFTWIKEIIKEIYDIKMNQCLLNDRRDVAGSGVSGIKVPGDGRVCWERTINFLSMLLSKL